MRRLTAILAALAIGIFAAVGTAATMPAQFTDVVVIGGGTAGFAAATAAASKGSTVVLIEMMSSFGGATSITSGTISGAGSKIQQKQGITDSAESHFMDVMKEGQYRAIPELLYLHTSTAGKTIDWLVDLGVEIKEAVFAPEHTLYTNPRSYKPAKVGAYAAVFAKLKEAADKSGKVSSMADTKAIKLIKDQLSGRIEGVYATDKDGKLFAIYARQGVVIATGGYANNPKLMAKYVPGSDEWLYITWPGSTGDGILMAEEIGAALTHMDCVPTFNMALKMPNGSVALTYTRAELFGGIYVNKNAKRWVNELAANSERELMLREQPGSLQIEIFDKTVFDLNGRTHFDGLADQGAIFKANSIEELAVKAGIDPVELRKTIDRYNSFIEKGTDLDFGKKLNLPDGKRMPKIEKAPFYAVPVKPLVLMTLGGVLVNDKLMVVDKGGKAMAGLYAAGEVVGGVQGALASSGMGVGVAANFGRLAGENVADAKRAQYANEPKAAAGTVYKDGVYAGEARGYAGIIEVRVTVKAGVISKVEIISSNDTPSISAAAIAGMPERITKANSPEVQAVSGATMTSKGIMEAVKKALEGAK